MDFAAPAENKMKIKESENRDKYLDLAIELKKLWKLLLYLLKLLVTYFTYFLGTSANVMASKID